MHETTTGMDIFREVKKSVDGYNLEWKKLNCTTMMAAETCFEPKRV